MADIGSLTIILGVDDSGLLKARVAVKQFADKVQKTTNVITPALQEPFRLFSKTAIAHLAMTSQRLRTFGYLASAAITAPMVLAGKAITKMASEYEFSMQKIVGLTGTAQSVVNQWSDDIKSMAKDFGRKPQELAEGLYFIASSGIEGAQALDVLRLSAKAAASGLGETQVVANYLTSVLNAYRGTGLTAAYATDVLVAAVREGKAEATGFASAMGSVTPIASNLGVSLDQVAGSMAAITLTGSTAAQAATYLRGMFNVLMKETEKGADAMDEASKALGQMKTSYADLRKILREQGIMALMEKLNTLSAAYGETLVSKVFPNIRAMLGVLSLSGKNMQYNTKIMNEITNSTGALGKAFAAVSDTIKVRYDKAFSRIQVSMISFGQTIAEVVIPIIESISKKIEKLVQWFNSLSDAQKTSYLKWLLYAAALGPVSMALSVLGYTLTGIMNIMNSVIRGFQSLSLVASRPLLLIIAAIGAGILALVKYKKKVEETAMSNSKLSTELVKVNGELKKLKDLTEIDLEAMVPIQMWEAMQSIQKAYSEARKNALDAAKRAGLTEEEFYEGKRAGKYQKYIDQQVKIANEAKKKYEEINAAYNKWIDNFGKVEVGSKSIATATGNLTNSIEEQKSAIKGLLKQYQEELYYIEMMNKVSKGGTLFEFDIDTAKLDLVKQTLEGFVEELSKFGSLDVFSSMGVGLSLVGSSMTTILNGLVQQILQYKKAIASKEDEKQLRVLQMEADAFGNIAGKIEVVNYALQAAQRDLRNMFSVNAAMKGFIFSEEQIKKTVEKIQSLKTELVSLQNAQDIRWLIHMNDALHTASTRSNLLDGYINALENSLKNLSETGKGSTEEFRILARQMQKLTYAQEGIDMLSDAFTTLFQGIITEGRQMEEILVDIFRNMVNEILSQLARLIANEIFQAIIHATKISKALQAGEIVASIAGFGMAQGGTVPPGYPNDTYPARLTSGEKIIPAKETMGALERPATNIHITVDGEVSGKKLAFVLRRYLEG